MASTQRTQYRSIASNAMKWKTDFCRCQKHPSGSPIPPRPDEEIAGKPAASGVEAAARNRRALQADKGIVAPLKTGLGHNDRNGFGNDTRAIRRHRRKQESRVTCLHLR